LDNILYAFLMSLMNYTSHPITLSSFSKCIV
jgi:hypothetical protein